MINDLREKEKEGDGRDGGREGERERETSIGCLP